MPFFQTLEPRPGVRVMLWHLTENSDEVYALLPLELRPLCERAVDGISVERRRRERLAARFLLWQMGVQGEVRYSETGRPEISDGMAQISISHTGDWVAVALAEKTIGVDIEQWGERALRVAPRFLDKAELAMLDGTHSAEVATLLWSAKETLFKALGAEGVDFTRHLCIKPFTYVRSEAAHRFEAVEMRTERNTVFRVDYFSFPDFVLTLTCRE